MFAHISYLRALYTTVFPYTIRNESFEPSTNWHTWRNSFLRSFATTMRSVAVRPAIIDDNAFQDVRRFRNRFACCSNFQLRLRWSLDRRFRATFVTHVRSAEIGRPFDRENRWIWCWDKQWDITSKREQVEQRCTEECQRKLTLRSRERKERKSKTERSKQTEVSSTWRHVQVALTRVSISLERCRISLTDTRSIYRCSMYRYRIFFLNYRTSNYICVIKRIQNSKYKL